MFCMIVRISSQHLANTILTPGDEEPAFGAASVSSWQRIHKGQRIVWSGVLQLLGTLFFVFCDKYNTGDSG